MTTQRRLNAERDIALWLNIIAGDGLTDADLFQAAVALRMAVRARKNEPPCDYCQGAGEYLGHSPDCTNDQCVMAGGLYDCDGVVCACDCAAAVALRRATREGR